MKKAIIFDFDGTLVQSHDHVYDVLCELAQEFKLKVPSRDQIQHMSTSQIIKAMGVRFWQIPSLTASARKRLATRLPSAELEPQIANTLKALKEANFKLGLVTSNSQANVDFILGKFQIDSLFAVKVTEASLLSKHRQIVKACRALSVKPSDVIYVGDETRDIEACRKAGVVCAAVTWGFHSKENLQQSHPDYLVDSPLALQTQLLSQFEEKDL